MQIAPAARGVPSARPSHVARTPVLPVGPILAASRRIHPPCTTKISLPDNPPAVNLLSCHGTVPDDRVDHEGADQKHPAKEPHHAARRGMGFQAPRPIQRASPCISDHQTHTNPSASSKPAAN